ncbi:hypothetical protein [Glycomyces terrestris]|uniref:hypothetical protein n=1 Tax=Glycomyces terrestris TaxID=2493553 RepID=UPI001315A495|nr:hypothetical protein [Glycomyces terrestris]
MSPSPAGAGRRTLLLAAGAAAVLAGLGAPRPARAEPPAAPAQEAAAEDRPHRTLLGVI